MLVKRQPRSGPNLESIEKIRMWCERGGILFGYVEKAAICDGQLVSGDW